MYSLTVSWITLFQAKAAIRPRPEVVRAEIFLMIAK